MNDQIKISDLNANTKKILCCLAFNRNPSWTLYTPERHLGLPGDHAGLQQRFPTLAARSQAQGLDSR